LKNIIWNSNFEFSGARLRWWEYHGKILQDLKIGECSSFFSYWNKYFVNWPWKFVLFYWYHFVQKYHKMISIKNEFSRTTLHNIFFKNWKNSNTPIFKSCKIVVTWGISKCPSVTCSWWTLYAGQTVQLKDILHTWIRVIKFIHSQNYPTKTYQFITWLLEKKIVIIID